MKIHRIDHAGVVVNDLSAAKAFFLDFGLEVQGEWESEGEGIELIQYISPSDEREIQLPFANTPGIRHLAFVVEDIEAIVASLHSIFPAKNVPLPLGSGTFQLRQAVRRGRSLPAFSGGPSGLRQTPALLYPDCRRCEAPG
ncbi:VOC family protein [Paenibacillus sonchi]|uniref:VOC family protein n=1 Tax=Paenibacillus sonchi TaxID=373687 RepID=A0A974SCH6_9BACL|nr:VOC family protein [Paenibacillus sonchi]QQZ60867.1 VOC family protein [Paenibacillus sonchi]